MSDVDPLYDYEIDTVPQAHRAMGRTLDALLKALDVGDVLRAHRLAQRALELHLLRTLLEG